MSEQNTTQEDKKKKKSPPMWRDFDLGRLLIWSTWTMIYFSLFMLPSYENLLSESVYLLLRICTIASVVIVPVALMPFVGTWKVLKFLVQTILYPIAIPFLVMSFLMEIRRGFKKIIGHPLLGFVHYSVVVFAIIYGFSVKEIFVWDFLSPLYSVFIVTNIVWATAWICRPMRFIATINGWIKKNEIKIVENLAKNFLKTKKLEDSKSVIKLTEGLTRLLEGLNSPFLVTIIFITVMVPVLITNILLFALIIKGDYIASAGAAIKGDLFSPGNIEFIKLSVASFIGHDLFGVDIGTRITQEALLLNGVSGIYFLVGIFFAYSSFGLIRATDTIKGFQDLVAALTDALKRIAAESGLEEGKVENEKDKNFINAQLSIQVKQDGSQDFTVS